MHVYSRACRCTLTCMYGLCMWKGHRSTPGVIPRAPSTLFCGTGSFAGLELTEWLSWLVTGARGSVCLPVPVPQGWGFNTCHHVQLLHLGSGNQTQALMLGKGGVQSQKPARRTETATSGSDLPNTAVVIKGSWTRWPGLYLPHPSELRTLGGAHSELINTAISKEALNGYRPANRGAAKSRRPGQKGCDLSLPTNRKFEMN